MTPEQDPTPVGPGPALATLADPDRHRETLLALVGRAVGDGDPALALRYADRARRLSPRNAVLIRLCARLLGQLDRPAEGLALLARADDLGGRDAQGLLRAELMTAAGDLAGAVRTLTELLTLYALEALPGFEALARAVCASPGTGLQGWTGLSWRGGLAGALSPTALGRLARLAGETGATLTVEQPPAGAAGDLARFHLTCDGLPDEIATAVLPTFPMIGGEALRWPPPWRLDGAVDVGDGARRGWVSLGWAPEAPLAVVGTDAEGREHRRLTTPGADDARSPVQVFAVQAGATAVDALLPDGGRVRIFAATTAQPPPPPAKSEPPAGVCVIVPVYAGLEETLACLHSVLRTTDRRAVEVIAVWDCGPEPALLAALQAMAEAGRITLLINERNLGFPGAVNRGMALRPDRDIVLLNADAEVYGDWLYRLAAVAGSAPDIATVTPFSNRGAIMAWPPGDDLDCDSEFAARLDGELSAYPGEPVDLPTGVGFCLYITRACLAGVGDFDEQTFGHGYGEENDFCLRASAVGWRHLAAPNVFVRHAGGRSFGALKAVLMETNLRVLSRRYPDYVAEVARFVARDPLHPARRWLDSRLIAVDSRPAVLLVTLGRKGGVERHVAERTDALTTEGWRVLKLAPDAGDEAGDLCRVTAHGEPFADLAYRLPGEWEALIAVLARLRIARVEFHHTLGLDSIVLDLPARLGAPFDIVVHDYSWICPRITLIDGAGRYCGEPDIAACERCIAVNGALIEEGLSVTELRSRSARLFHQAAAVTAPSGDVATRLRRHFPWLTPRISPWEPPIPTPACRAAPPGDLIRAAVIGAIGEHKGYGALLACARDAAARDLPLDFVVIGFTEDDSPLFDTGRVFITGPFEEGEAQGLLARERCDVLLFASVAPETWSYALSDGLRSGLPIVALAFGAVAERLEGVGRARLLPPGADPAALNDALIAAARPAPVVSLRTRADGEPWIQAVSVSGPEGLSYAARLAGAGQTPWTPAGAWCGDPAGDRPLIAFAVRPGAACHAVFASGATAAAADGDFAQSPYPNDPMVALEVELRVSSPNPAIV